MWFSCTETYPWIAHTSSSLVIYWCWHILVWKMFQNFNTAFDYLLMLTIFDAQNVLIILDWCLYDFFVLKHIHELCTCDLPFVVYWCWHIFVWKMFQNFNIAFVYLLMLTIGHCHVQNVLIILDRFLCDFPVLKHTDELYTLHLHWLFTNVDQFWCGKCFRISILLLIIYWCWLFFMCKMFLSFSIDDYVIFLYQKICINCIHIHIWVLCWDFFMHVLFFVFMFRSIVFSVNNVLTLGAFGSFSFVINLCEISLSFSSDSFQYCFWLFTDVDYIFYVQNVLIILNWCLCDLLVLKHINEVDALHLHLSFTDVDICFVWKIFQNFNIVFDYLLMLTPFHVQNILIIVDWCLCEFLVLKHIDEVYALHLHLSFSFVDIFSRWKCSRISIVLLIIYWCWLFFLCKMSLSFCIDVYVIFLYWNISIKCMHFMFICHLLMLTYFCI